MKKPLLILSVIFCVVFNVNAQQFSLEQVTSYPFISEVTTAANKQIIAFSVYEKGLRNVYVAKGPSYELQKITDYNSDEGKEITGLTFSHDGKWLLFVRGGDHGAFDETIPRNPSSLPEKPVIEIFSINLQSGKQILLGEGDEPVISPDNKQVIFIKDHQAWIVPIDGSQPAKNLFYCKGRTSSLQYSPDGSLITFVTSRGDHSFIGIYKNAQTPLQYISPDFSIDQSPRWSPDGSQIVFVRRPSGGGPPDSITVDKIRPWSIWVADIKSNEAHKLWQSPLTLEGSVPSTSGRYNLHWAANNRIVFLSYQDGWPHMYSIPATGGNALLLTPGAFNTEQITLSPDKKSLLFITNTGADKNDFERRHVARVPVDEAKMELLTQGNSIQSSPAFLDDSKIVFLNATAQQPGLPAIVNLSDKKARFLGQSLIPRDFPLNKLITPRHVEFKAADGKMVYGQLFEPGGATGKRPAILFVHGGPERQMLLGWHYMDYYANTYALNQYLASKGFVVLSVNYRLGIGYGYDFQNPKNSWRNGASEYQDIKAAGEWLQNQAGVDAEHIGIYGGSYGGYLTAMALARDSKIFKAGVDISGLHDLFPELPEYGYEKPPDLELAKKLTWESSPDAYLDTWTSSVLIITGDDDGNVPFSQSSDLVKRFREKQFPFESLVVPDETHHWMKYANMLKMDQATADFLEKKLVIKTASKGIKGKTICIDAGHGGTSLTDQYRKGIAGEREEWINLRVAQLLQKKLEKEGAKVVMTRNSDVFIPLPERAAVCRENNADVFLSIHHNATADTSVNFPIIYFHGASSENLAGVALAKDVAFTLKKDFYRKKIPESIVSDYTIFPEKGAAVLRETYGIPAILSEASFFSNPSEEQRLKQESYNEKEASAYAKALEKFFSNPVPGIKPLQIPSSLPPFPVFEEADRMNPVAKKWYDNFLEGKKLMKSNDTLVLRKALELFTISAKSFPDSYVAKACHQNMAILFKKLGDVKMAAEESERASEFYVE